MDLSIVIPAYNEAHRLPKTLPIIFRYLVQTKKQAEVIVVNDGSTDDTAQIVRGLNLPIRLIEHPRNLGKGAAVRTGMLAAEGEWRYLCDADLSTPIEDVAKLEQWRSTADIIIGSRRVPGAIIERSQAAWKVALGQIGNLAIRLLLVPGIHDTQCGFKLFHHRTNIIFQKQRLQRWGFDFELLYLARRFGFRLREVPVRWHNDPDSKVRPLDYLRTAAEILAIFLNRWRGFYQLP